MLNFFSLNINISCTTFDSSNFRKLFLPTSGITGSSYENDFPWEISFFLFSFIRNIFFNHVQRVISLSKLFEIKNCSKPLFLIELEIKSSSSAS